MLLLSSHVHGWITVSPEGNMTLMTTAQVGDWDHGTTGEPKDLYVTGDVHIGKTNGSLFVQGDIMVRHPFAGIYLASDRQYSSLFRLSRSWTVPSGQTTPISQVES